MKKPSFDKYRLLAPGPVPLSLEVREELGQEMIHHRTPLFDQILKEVLQNLKWVFQTEQPVFIHSATGSGAMESALINCFNPGEKVLCVVSGKFGQRWSEMGKSFGLRVEDLQVPWGQAVDLAQVQGALELHPDTQGLLIQACETSTATLHPLRELAEKLRQSHPHVLLVVDAITALGATPLPMDEWGLDVVVAGSQKAFQLPTGLSFISLSQRAWERSQEVKTPRYYFDLHREWAANQRGETFFSSSVALIRALRPVLKSFQGQGLQLSISRCQELMEKSHQMLSLLGLELFSQAPSPSVTALKVPQGVDGQLWRKLLEEKYNITLMGGQDHLKGQILRMGHLGAIEDQDMEALAWALGLSLNELKENSVADEAMQRAGALFS